ncbi:MAG: D-tyrosyl-tRNA(Tyr) deacylase [Marinilabiliaceae bacterium]|nr:D-tyrosyl-tRNA(Tyr) deacylase [Marinilabiliaceae bacterium]
MRVVIQRVSEASVTIDGEIVGKIGQGLLLLYAVEAEEDDSDIDWLVNKIVKMRIFSDELGLMNRSIQDIDGEILVISQFTLFAETKKGCRPSFIRSAKPETAEPLYELFVEKIASTIGKRVETGRFGADMKVRLLNDGPVTIIIDSKNRE